MLSNLSRGTQLGMVELVPEPEQFALNHLQPTGPDSRSYPRGAPIHWGNRCSLRPHGQVRSAGGDGRLEEKARNGQFEEGSGRAGVGAQAKRTGREGLGEGSAASGLSR